MGDILYRLQGVNLIDRRWENTPVHTERGPRCGAWELLKGTSLLPNLPGFQVTAFRRPRQQGESRVQHAPANPRGVPLPVRIYAIDPDPASPTYGREGRDVGEQLRPSRPRCGDKNRRGEACQKWAIKYATRCMFHGGKSPQAQQAAERRRAQSVMAQELTRLGV